MHVHYLEIVTPDVEKLCSIYEAAHGITFSGPESKLGNARIANLSNGGRIGIRAPMSAEEVPVIRPYVLVDDIEAAVKNAESAGAEIIHPPLEIPGHGTFAICMSTETQHGFWQL